MLVPEIEEWRPISGFPAYAISSLGNVRRVARGRGSRFKTPRLTGNVMQIGYRCVSIHSRQRYVHRLVAATFIGPPPDGCEVNHKNGDRLDNRVENLEYISHRDNLFHARQVLGRIPRSSLNASLVRKIRAEPRTKSTRELATEYGVSYGVIWDIRKGSTWKWLM